MEVLIIQPPTKTVVAFDQTDLRASHIAPPWDAMCLLGYLHGRSRHTGRIFDARKHVRWEAELERNLTTKTPAIEIAAIQCGRHDLSAVQNVVATLRRLQPGLPLVGFGELPTLSPTSFRTETGMDYGIVGDPEPVMRQLLDNFALPFRRKRIAGLLQEDSDAATPIWSGDLRTLACPDWNDVTSWAWYEGPCYPGGLRADVALTRGATAHPIDALLRPGGAPLRIWPFEQIAAALQECAHIGMLEVHFTDPPHVWDEGRLDAWLTRLTNLQNAQDWSLRLLAMPLDIDMRQRLVEQRCRRVELLIPSCDPRQAAHNGYEIPDHAQLTEMIRWFHSRDVLVDLIFWIGNPDEPRGEARRILDFLRNQRYGPFALEIHPRITAEEPRVASIVRSIRLGLTLSPIRRLRKLLSHFRQLRVTIDQEHREIITHMHERDR